MSSIPYDLTKIKGFIFDVDGVLSCNVISLYPDGDPMRTVCIKDGYAMQLAVKKGYQLAIITGAYTEAVVKRYERLGLKYIYTKSSIKVNDYNDFMQRSGLKPEEVVYVGDDIPDYEVMKRCGCACCPSDAAPDIKSVSTYVSSRAGGYGCGRDVIEQVLRAQHKWLADEKAFGW